MLEIVFAIAFRVQSDAVDRDRVPLASSEVIEIARVAVEQWQKHPLAKMSYFDIVAPSVDKMPGYASVIYYVDNDIVMGVSINQRTGQVIDTDRCLIFRGPYFERLGKRVRSMTGVAEISEAKLAESVGCDHLAAR